MNLRSELHNFKVPTFLTPHGSLSGFFTTKNHDALKSRRVKGFEFRSEAVHLLKTARMLPDKYPPLQSGCVLRQLVLIVK